MAIVREAALIPFQRPLVFAAGAWRRWRDILLLLLVKIWKTSQDVIGGRCQVSRVVVVEIAEESRRGLACNPETS